MWAQIRQKLQEGLDWIKQRGVTSPFIQLPDQLEQAIIKQFSGVALLIGIKFYSWILTVTFERFYSTAYHPWGVKQEFFFFFCHVVYKAKLYFYLFIIIITFLNLMKLILFG